MTKLYKYGDYEVIRIDGEIVIAYKGEVIETCENHLDAVLKMNEIKKLEYAN